MSHTTGTSQGTVFIHNGDYSSYVTVQSPRQPETEMLVPFADLREFVFGYLRMRMTEQLEQANDDTFEQMLTNGTGVAW